MLANFVNRWHMNEGESQAMWKIYAGDEAGVAIRSTVVPSEISQLPLLLR
jgi:hypothetical protein